MSVLQLSGAVPCGGGNPSWSWQGIGTHGDDACMLVSHPGGLHIGCCGTLAGFVHRLLGLSYYLGLQQRGILDLSFQCRLDS